MGDPVAVQLAMLATQQHVGGFLISRGGIPITVVRYNGAVIVLVVRDAAIYCHQLGIYFVTECEQHGILYVSYDLRS